jgi:hypothetical protein
VSAGTAPPLPLEIVAGRTESAGRDSASGLSRREATLRSAATTCLAGIALAQAIQLPSLLVQGAQYAVLSVAAMVLCIGLGLALAGGPASASRQLWQVVAATAVLVLAGWAAPRAFAVPGLADHRGHWMTLPGALCGALAAVCLGLAAAGAPLTWASVRGLAAAVAVLGALAPGAGALLVALGPGPARGEAALGAGVHVHSQAGLEQTQLQFQPIPGGHGGHYVYRAAATPHQTALGVAIVVAAALVFLYGALGHLRRRRTLTPPSRPRHRS